MGCFASEEHEGWSSQSQQDPTSQHRDTEQRRGGRSESGPGSVRLRRCRSGDGAPAKVPELEATCLSLSQR